MAEALLVGFAPHMRDCPGAARPRARKLMLSQSYADDTFEGEAV